MYCSTSVDLGSPFSAFPNRLMDRPSRLLHRPITASMSPLDSTGQANQSSSVVCSPISESIRSITIPSPFWHELDQAGSFPNNAAERARPLLDSCLVRECNLGSAGLVEPKLGIDQ